RQEDGVELEPLRAVQRQQVDAARRARAEEPLELGLELGHVVEPSRDGDDPPEVVLPRLLALAESLRRHLEPAELTRRAPYDLLRGAGRAAHPLQEAARTLARQERGALERD